MTRTPPLPLWHATDPATSREAAVKHRNRAVTNRDIVVGMVRAKPSRTAGELAALIDALDLIEVRRRLSDAKRAGLVCAAGASECRVLGNRATVWVVTGGDE